MIKKDELLYIFGVLKNKDNYKKCEIRNSELKLFNMVKEMVLKYVNDPNRTYRGYFNDKDDFLQRSFCNIFINLHNIKIVPRLNRRFFATAEQLPIIDGKRCEIINFNSNTEEFTLLWKYRKYSGVKIENMRIKLLKSAYMASETLLSSRGVKSHPDIIGKLIKIVYRFKSTVVVLHKEKLYLVQPDAIGFNNLHSYLTYIIDDSVKQVLKEKKEFKDTADLELILSGHVDVIDRNATKGKMYDEEVILNENEVL